MEDYSQVLRKRSDVSRDPDESQDREGQRKQVTSSSIFAKSHCVCELKCYAQGNSPSYSPPRQHVLSVLSQQSGTVLQPWERVYYMSGLEINGTFRLCSNLSKEICRKNWAVVFHVISDVACTGA